MRRKNTNKRTGERERRKYLEDEKEETLIYAGYCKIKRRGLRKERK